MKMLTRIMAVAALVIGISQVHAEKLTPGPKGGRLLENDSPRAEFLVEKDKTVTITFYDKDLKAVSPGEQVVTAIAEAKGGKTKIEFEKKGDVLVSKTPLPEGNDYNLVVQFKQAADAKPVNLRFKLDLGICGECKRAEYACTCDH